VHALVVGLGAIGQRHARNLRALLGPGLRLSAYRVRGLAHVVTPQLEADAGRDVERVLGIEAFGDLDDALAQRPDIAIVANPTSAHVDVALACARAGCHLFVEKPLSHTLDGIDQLTREVEARGRVAMVGYQLRFHPGFERFAEVVESGRLGNLLAVRATVGEYLPDWHKYEDYRTMYAARADLGGGVVLTQIHEYDYLCALFGMPQRLFALGGRWSRLDLDVEDTASVLMECAQGERPLPVHLAQDYLQRPTSRTCEAVGDRGKALLDFALRTVTVWEDGVQTARDELESFDRNDLYLAELRHFLKCVAGGMQPVVDLREGRKSLEIALAVKRSIALHAAVDLAPERAAYVA
jgi:predicted dehydrogenase